MAQDTVADAMNMMRNAKKARKEIVKIKLVSNLLVEILKIMKRENAIKKYKIDARDRSMEVTLGDFLECKVIKPRFMVKKDEIERYKRRYLPARNMGTVLVSTSKGLMTHEEAAEAGLGGSLIAFFY
ncbi:MAG: 30S ribosomal protein S8 [Nanoarchaeota archaeon]|nr:30S ribosomal protein S8 [Nanoarchaeota archaeon]MBU1501153.1 30S ribosomal protein S8 [Nanoarchaeota archaeon]MBU2458833.1 30S ribosomal protein S8 [Nanoarchaeota archaeon]